MVPNHLLGRAAGVPYPDLVARRVLGPLGLESTGFDLPVVPGARKGKPAPPWTFGALGAAGALRSSVGDLLRFAAACLDPLEGTLGEALRLAARPVHFRRGGGQGLGWMLRPRAGRGGAGWDLWHEGGTYATSSFLAVDPAGRVAVAAFGSTGPGLVSRLTRPGWALLDDHRGA